MSIKKNPPATPSTKSDYTPIGARGFTGKNVKLARVASGVKLELKQDDEMFGRYVGCKDISDRVANYKPEDGAIIYHTFFDGKRLVTLPSSYALREKQEKNPFVPMEFYYLLNEAEIESNFPNPMKDITIVEFGPCTDGEPVGVPERIDKSRKIYLNDAELARLNYTVINYPLK